MGINADAKDAGVALACVSIAGCSFILVLLRRLVCSSRAGSARGAKNFAVLKLVGVMCVFLLHWK